LNTIVAESLCQFADVLEGSKDFKADLAALVKKTYCDHKRIIFNGNNYSDEWVIEAQKRGLSNLRTTVDAMPMFTTKKSIDVFTKHHVFTEGEIHSRFEILMEAYCKTINIEALTMIDMVKGMVMPACICYQNELAKLLERKKACGDFDTSLEGDLLGKISKLSGSMLKKLEALEAALSQSKDKHDIHELAKFTRDSIFASMSELRIIVDELETLVSRKCWPFPVYGELLFSVI